MKFKGWLLIAALLMAQSQGAAADSDRPVENPLDALAGTAAIVEGSVAGHDAAYDEAAGPRTIARLSDVRTHFGRYADRTLELPMLDGRIDDGRWLYIPELPRFTEDTRYLLFLTNSAWFYSPVVAEYAFRLEPGPRGGDVLIDPSGHAVVGLTAEGVELSDEPVVDMQLDFLQPHAKQRLIDPALLTGAMSKEAFLAAVQDLARTAPLQGDFRPAPAGDRVWNQMTTAAER
jgi:hypothetical protein